MSTGRNFDEIMRALNSMQGDGPLGHAMLITQHYPEKETSEAIIDLVLMPAEK